MFRAHGIIPACLLALVLAPSVGGSALAGPESSRQEEVVAKLNSVKISLYFADAPLPEVLDFVRSFAGIDFFIDPKVRERLNDEQLKVSMKVNNLPLRAALRIMLSSKNLAAVYRDGVIVIVPKEEADKDVVLKIYDVRDLLMKVEDHAGPVIELRPPGQAGGALTGVVFNLDPEPKQLTVEFITEMIKKNCGGTTWDTNPNASINLNNGLLMVSQTPKVHAEILGMVDKLRQYK
jgi:type II secretory pathway component GspD/PulD (secretin)